MRMRRKPRLEERMQECSGIMINNINEVTSCRDEKCEAVKIRLELGCGKGKFTVSEAAENPEILFIAIEKTADALVIAMERAINLNVSNIRFIHGDIENISDYTDGAEIDCIYINFSDPWPSNRHIKRRLTSRLFIEKYSKILRNKGEIRLKTDNLPFFEFSLRELEYCGYTLFNVTRNLHENGIIGHMTDYEEKFHGMGIPICGCVAVKNL